MSLPQPEGLVNQVAGQVKGPVEVTVVDLINISVSRQAQISTLSGDGGRRAAQVEPGAELADGDTDFDSYDSQRDRDMPDTRKSPLVKYAVQDSAGTLMHLIYSSLTPAPPVLGINARLIIANCELHRGVLVATLATARPVALGSKPSDQAVLGRLAADLQQASQ